MTKRQHSKYRKVRIQTERSLKANRSASSRLSKSEVMWLSLIVGVPFFFFVKTHDKILNYPDYILYTLMAVIIVVIHFVMLRVSDKNSFFI